MSVTQAAQLIQERGGEEKAIAYVTQCRRQFRRSVLSSTRGNLYRAEWIKSYVEAKQYLNARGVK